MATGSTRRYVRILAGTLLPLWAATAGFNLAVDPYAAAPALGVDRLDDFRWNANRATKAERLRRGTYDVVVFGTSVANQCCDPADPVFEGARVFDAGLPGGNLHETRIAFDYALDHGRPKTVVLFVDLVGLSGARTTIGDFAQSRFDPGCRVAEYRLRQILGWDATMDSIGVLRDAAHPSAEDARAGADGFRRRPVPARPTWEDFAKTLRTYLVEEWNRFRYSTERVAYLREMLDRCRREGVRAVVVVPPLHATALEGIRLMGLWDDLERMEGDVMGAVEQAAATPSKAPPPVAWDFTGWDGPRAEPIALEGRGEMLWFSDPVHPTAALGSVLLARAFHRDDLAPPGLRGFGVRLTREGLAAHLAALRAGRDGWARGHAGEAERMARLHADTAEERAKRLRLAGAGGDAQAGD
jgi:hypothetical protein